MDLEQAVKAEIDKQKEIINTALVSADKARTEGKISGPCHQCFAKAADYIVIAAHHLEIKNYEKAVYMMSRAVANYYLGLGANGVLRD